MKTLIFYSGAFLLTLGVLTALSLLNIWLGFSSTTIGNITDALTGAWQDQLSVALIYHLSFPRIILAILVGASTAVSGCLIQQSLHNEFASPSTLGISAGAMLATLLAGVFAADSLSEWPILIAFIGALLSGSLVYCLANIVSSSPVNIILVGMAISLALGAVSAALLMMFEAKLDGFYIWGAGNLAHGSIQQVVSMVPKIIALLVLALLLGRQLSILNLGDTMAGHLGINVPRLRLFALLLSILLSAIVVSYVGIIAFIGLISPHVARYLGVKSIQQQILVSACCGSILLLLADCAAIYLGGDNYLVPTGAMTALIGAPFMMYLLRRQSRQSGKPYDSQRMVVSQFFYINPRVLISSLMLLLLFSFVFFYHQLSSIYLPRLLVSCIAGVGLATAGLLLQTLLKNPLASPDVVGVNSTAILVVVLIGTITPLTRNDVFLITIITLLSLCTIASFWLRASGYSPARWTLIGVCLSALSGTGITLVMSLSATQSTEALLWLAGTSYGVGLNELLYLSPIVVMVLALLCGPWRWLNMLQLGFQQAAHLGLGKNNIVVLVVVTIFICALCVATVGGIAFIGLMAPHIAKVFGLANQRHLLMASALIGAWLFITADFISITLLFPFELPTGLVVSIIGGLYFITLLVGSRYQQKRAN